MVDFGSQGLVGGAQIGLGIQEEKRKKQEQALAPSNQAIDLEAQKSLGMVTITPQMAQIAAKASGDDGWLRLGAGSQMKKEAFTALLSYGVHENLRQNLEKMHENFGLTKEEMKEMMQKSLEQMRERAAQKRVETHEKGVTERKGLEKDQPTAGKAPSIGGKGSLTPEDRDKDRMVKFLNIARSSNKDADIKRSAIASYNEIAKKYGMPQVTHLGMVESLLQKLGFLGGTLGTQDIQKKNLQEQPPAENDPLGAR
jgi:hypothetical protein